MEPITFVIANDLSVIPVVQAGAVSYLREAGAEDDIVRQTELVIEEVITNILQYEYLDGQRETLSLTLSLCENFLEWRIRFRGIPFDIENLKQWKKRAADTNRIIESDGRGLGLLLLQHYSDDVTYRNLGWQGQEVIIRRKIPLAENTPLAAKKNEIMPVTCEISIRRMRPEDASAISKLAYFAYRYTYIREYVYDPEKVRRANEDGRMKSYVIVENKTGEILGHMAQFPDDLFGYVPEVAAGFVHPRFRGGGSFNELTERMIRDAATEGCAGVCGMAVTSHFYSQKAALRSGMKESALFVSRVRSLTLPDIKEKPSVRESFLYLVRMIDLSPRQPWHAPTRHSEMIAKIARNVGITATFAKATPDAPLPDRGEMDYRADNQLCGHLVVRRWGRDTLQGIHRVVKDWCLDRLETIYLYLPLTEPATAVYYGNLEEQGFFFSGVMPGQKGADNLVMQFLNNQRYDYSSLQAATPFGKALIDYVRHCDPDAGDVPSPSDET